MTRAIDAPPHGPSVPPTGDHGTDRDGDFLPLGSKRRMQQGMSLSLLKAMHAFNLTSNDVCLFHDPAVAQRAEV